MAPEADDQPPVIPPPAAALDAPEGPSPLGPVRAGERIFALDVLRGFAILGIFVVNIAFFAMPLMAAIGTFLTDEPREDQLTWAAVRTLGEFKFVSLFSLMFGMGMIVQLSRAEAAGRRFLPVYLRRLIVLALFGFLHIVMLWYGDILLMYAVAGLLLLFARRARGRTLVIAGALVIGIGGLLVMTCSGFSVLSMQRPASEPAPPALSEVEPAPVVEQRMEETAAPVEEAAPAEAETPVPETFDERLERVLELLMASQKDIAAVDEADRIVYRGDPTRPMVEWWGPMVLAMMWRAMTYLWIFGLSIFSGFGARVVGTFLIGAGLMRLGFFKPEHRAWHWRLFLLGVGIGLPLEAATAVHRLATGGAMDLGFVLIEGLHYYASFVLCFGYLGAIVLLAGVPALTLPLRGFAAVGRMALTCYIGETLIATTLMYWYGFNWFDETSRVDQMKIVFAGYAALMVFAFFWLRFFRMGPLEWVWRTATYGKVPPLRR